MRLQSHLSGFAVRPGLMQTKCTDVQIRLQHCSCSAGSGQVSTAQCCCADQADGSLVRLQLSLSGFAVRNDGKKHSLATAVIPIRICCSSRSAALLLNMLCRLWQPWQNTFSTAQCCCAVAVHRLIAALWRLRLQLPLVVRISAVRQIRSAMMQTQCTAAVVLAKSIL